MNMSKAVRRWVFGAATAGALGFGGTQALAAPAPAAPAAPGAKVCDDRVCDRICDLTNRGLGGFCSSTGICVCWR